MGIASDPTKGTDSDTYGAGDVIEITVTFSEDVVVAGITPAGCPCPGPEPGQLTPRVATPTVVLSELEGQDLCYGAVACVQTPPQMQRRE